MRISAATYEAYSEFIMIMNELLQYMYDNGLIDIFDGMSLRKITSQGVADSHIGWN